MIVYISEYPTLSFINSLVLILNKRTDNLNEQIYRICRELRDVLMKCAATTLSSKLVAHQKDFFATMVVDAVQMLDELLPLNMIGIKKVQGGGLEVGCWLIVIHIYSVQVKLLASTRLKAFTLCPHLCDINQFRVDS